MFLASTGVIGEVLPHERITRALPALHAALTPDGWEAAARGIMTTDTFPESSQPHGRCGRRPKSRIVGIAKGSGMIAPDMATMLCFVFTDAAIPAAALQAMLSRRVETTFNRTTVDSDTSTSDTVLLFATRQAKHAAANLGPLEADADLGPFETALEAVLMDLALQVIRDGEGAQKLIRIDVTGAARRCVGQAGRHGGGELAAGQDGHRRRGRQLGPHRHGGGQGGRAGRPRPAVYRRSAAPGWRATAAWWRATTRPPWWRT